MKTMVCGVMKVSLTRFAGLGYSNICRGLWMFVDTATQSQVGPHYRTKAELLCDLHRYAHEYFGEFLMVRSSSAEYKRAEQEQAARTARIIARLASIRD